MKVKFRIDQTEQLKPIIQHLTSLERASIVYLPPFEKNMGYQVHLNLHTNTLDDLKRYMLAIPGGEAMMRTVSEVQGEVREH